MTAVLLMALVTTTALLPRILRIAHKKQLYDWPGQRKVHHTPIPRLGGLAFFPVGMVVTGLATLLPHLLGCTYMATDGDIAHHLQALLVGGTVLFVVGATDDLVGVGYKKKFLAQFVASLALVASGVWIQSLDGFLGIHHLPLWAGIPLTLFLVVLVTNAINLIDGIDGLAAGLCLIALAMMACLYLHLRLYLYAALAVAAAGTVVPFWFYNVLGSAEKKTKIYMGDAGSLILGYLLSFLMVRLSMTDAAAACAAPFHTCHYLVLGVSPLLVPLLDVAKVVAIRLSHRRNPFLPDNNHIHHRLMRCGLTMRQAMVAIYALSLTYTGINVLLASTASIHMVFAADVALFAACHAAVSVTLRRRGGQA